MKMNNVCHVEIPTTDLERAINFFENLFNWKVNTEAIPNYGLVHADVSVGIPVRDKVEPNIRRVYFQVSDIAKYLMKAEELGGTVVNQKAKISDEIGYSASFKDLDGNIIGIFAPQ